MPRGRAGFISGIKPRTRNRPLLALYACEQRVALRVGDGPFARQQHAAVRRKPDRNGDWAFDIALPGMNLLQKSHHSLSWRPAQGQRSPEPWHVPVITKAACIGDQSARIQLPWAVKTFCAHPIKLRNVGGK
ncbi:hypothetical protein D3C71_1777670 [compost metagenome]